MQSTLRTKRWSVTLVYISPLSRVARHRHLGGGGGAGGTSGGGLAEAAAEAEAEAAAEVFSC